MTLYYSPFYTIFHSVSFNLNGVLIKWKFVRSVTKFAMPPFSIIKVFKTTRLTRSQLSLILLSHKSLCCTLPRWNSISSLPTVSLTTDLHPSPSQYPALEQLTSQHLPTGDGLARSLILSGRAARSRRDCSPALFHGSTDASQLEESTPINTQIRMNCASGAYASHASPGKTPCYTSPC